VHETLPHELMRKSAFLTHPVFTPIVPKPSCCATCENSPDRDLALDRAMIPLGSCTMKLNATAEMIPLTWPAFGGLHPFAPPDQAAGYPRAVYTAGTLADRYHRL